MPACKRATLPVLGSTSFCHYPGLTASCCIHQEGVTLSRSPKLLEGSFRPDPIITPIIRLLRCHTRLGLASSQSFHHSILQLLIKGHCQRCDRKPYTLGKCRSFRQILGFALKPLKAFVPTPSKARMPTPKSHAASGSTGQGT